jgi:hypothetical protein
LFNHLATVKQISEKRYSIDPTADWSIFNQVVNTLAANKLGFTIYDREYPSPSDPGAYLSFFLRETSDGEWRLTLGNHGWSGGAYILPAGFVSSYLQVLFEARKITYFDVGSTGAKHYADESPESSSKLMSLLKRIHSFST